MSDVLRFIACAVVPAAFVFSGCGRSENESVTLVAATSMKAAVDTAVADFKRAHPDVRVRTTFAPSDQIQRQIEGGLDADVVVTASGSHMRPLLDAKLVEDAEPFAGNAMTIAVSRKSDVPIKDAGDLALKQRLSLGQTGVPVGDYADEVIATLDSRYKRGFAEKVAANVVNRASNAAEVITPVALGGVDSSLSYVTDVNSNATRVRSVALPAWAQPTIAYWIAPTPDASDGADALLDFIESPDGQEVLRAAGFLPVPAAAGTNP
ncbi:MAG: molybdate ABC transporter substrate-binding protein [Thermoleophilaceae bacterium]|nr:molybdate ABC transporter substrate-binding protein [Thermoleophilaceae bacterium]